MLVWDLDWGTAPANYQVDVTVTLGRCTIQVRRPAEVTAPLQVEHRHRWGPNAHLIWGLCDPYNP